MCVVCSAMGVDDESLTRNEVAKRMYKFFPRYPGAIIDFIDADVDTLIFTATPNGVVLSAGNPEEEAEARVVVVLGVVDGKITVLQTRGI